MTEHARPKHADTTSRAEIEETRSLRSRLARLERSEVKHGQTEDVYRSLIASLPQGLLIVQDGRIVLANDAMADLTGYSIDEMKTATPRQVRAFVHPEDRELVWGRHLDRLAGKPVPIHYEFRGIRKDGNTCWLEVYARTVEYGGEHAVQATFTDITERKKVELGLRQSNDLLRAIVEAAPTAIIGLDLDGNVHTVWNQAAEKMLGWTAQEAMGRPLPSVPAAGQEEFRGFRERIRRGLTLDGVEVRRQRRDGTPIDYSIYASPLHDADGAIAGNIAVLVDITEHKRMEAALRDSERKLEEAQRIAHVGHWEHDLDVGTITGSDETLRIFGVAPQERTLGFARFLELVHPEDKERVAQTVAEALRNRKIFDLEYRVVRPTGEVRFVYVQSNVTREESGRPRCLFGIVQDITERKQAAEALRRSEEKYRAIVDTATEGIWVLGPDTRTTFANARMAEILGVSYEETIGRTLTDFMYEEDIPDHLRKMQNRRDGVSENYERRFRRRDGRTVWTLVSATPVFDDERHFQGSFGMFTDITDRKRAEEELRRSENRYRIVADNTYDWEFWIGPDGRFLYSSPSCQRMTGHTADDFIRDPGLLKRLVHPDDQELFTLHCSHVMEDRTPEEIEYRIVLADGCVRHIGHVCQPIFDERGQYLGIRGSNRDITKHKQAEQAVALLSFALNNVREAALLIDEDARLHFVNEEACRVLGYTREELLALSLTDVDPDFPMERWRNHWNDLTTRRSLTFESRHRAKDGHTFPVEINANYFEYEGRSYNLGLVRDITERKRAEEVLRTSEGRYRMAQSIGHVGNWEYNLETTEFWGSDEAKRIYGVDPDQPSFATDEIENCIPERERVHQALIDLIKEGKPYNLEFEIRPANSSEPRIIASIAELQRDEHGAPLKVVGVIQDITDRRRAEDAVRQERSLLRQITETSPVGITMVNHEGFITFANRQAESVLGIKRKEIAHRTYNAPEWRITDFNGGAFPEEQLPFRQVMTTRRPVVDVRHAIEWPDGRRVYLSINGAPLMNDAGEIESVVLSLADITAQTQAEEALRESEARFRDLYENAPNAYFSIGSDGLVHRCNRRAGELLGHPVEELIGRSVMTLYADTTHGKEKAKQVLRRFQSGDVIHDEELEMQKADGNRVWISLTVDAIRDTQGQIIESRSMVVDITERKRAENIRNARLHLLQFAAAHSLDELLQATLDELELLTGSQIGFFHFLEADQQTLSLQAWSTRTLRDMCTAEGKSRHYSVSEAGVWVDCIRQRRPVIHNDYASLPHRKGMPPGHARVIRELVVPVFRGDRIMAILGVGNKPRDYVDEDVAVVSNLADVAWDIAERKRAEQALHASEQHLKAVVNGSPTPQFVIGRDHRIVYWNRVMEEYSGLRAEDMVGTREAWRAFYKSERPCLADLLVEGETDRIEQSYAGKCGPSRLIEGAFEAVDFFPDMHGGTWLSFTASQIRDKDGEILGAVETLVDITDLKRAEEVLRESEQRVRRKLDAILSPDTSIGALELSDVIDSEKIQGLMDRFYELTHVGIGIIDMRGKVLVGTGWQDICTKFHRANPESCRLCIESDLELSHNVPAGTFRQYRCKNNMWDIATPITIGGTHMGNIFLGQFLFDDETPDYDVFREQARRYGFDEQEYLIALGQIPRWSHDMVSAAMSFYAAFAELIGTLSYSNVKLASALEDRRRAEEEVRQLNRELERRVAERTAELRTVNEELEAFAYSVSHDLRAPLRHIDGFLDLLRKRTAGSLDTQSRHYVVTISESAKRMGILIDDLLSFSRMGRSAMARMQVDLNGLVREVIGELTPDVAARRIQWRIADLPTVRGDQAMLRMVLVNLLSNALKFTRQRSEAEIEIGCLPDRAKETTMFVRDNGVGFDMAYADRLFGVFQRLHRADEFEGTGIGLANVRRIISRHGGRTWAEGQVNKGATVYFALPNSPTENDHGRAQTHSLG